MNPIVKRYLKAGLNIILSGISIFLFVFVVPKAILYFMPFVIGWIVSCVANPLVQFLSEKMKLKRKAGSVIVIILVILAILALSYGILSVLIGQIIGFASSLPEIWKEFEKALLDIGIAFDKLVIGFPKEVQDTFISFFNGLDTNFSRITDSIGGNTVSSVGKFAKNIPAVVISIIMCILSAYWFVAARDETSDFLKKHLPVRLQERTLIVYSNLKSAVGGYFKAQVRIEAYIYILIVIGLLILQVPYALLIALGIGVLDMLPFFGTAIILFPWAIVELIQADYKMVIGLLLIWGVGQLVRQLIQPKIVGESIGVPPIPTLFLLFIGYKVGGVIGMIIAVPIGIIFIKLEEAGAFDTPKNSIRLFVKSINEFRRITPEDMEYIKKEIEESVETTTEKDTEKDIEKETSKENANIDRKAKKADIKKEEKHAREKRKKRRNEKY